MTLWYVFRTNQNGKEFLGRVHANSSLEACITVARNLKISSAGLNAVREILTKLEIQAVQNKESQE